MIYVSLFFPSFWQSIPSYFRCYPDEHLVATPCAEFAYTLALFILLQTNKRQRSFVRFLSFGAFSLGPISPISLSEGKRLPQIFPCLPFRTFTTPSRLACFPFSGPQVFFSWELNHFSPSAWTSFFFPLSSILSHN